MKLDEKELQKLRKISISRILGKENNGRVVSICCPVHSERTPSMVLYPNDNHFHCYGCGVHGRGAIDFLEALGYSFSEIIEELKKYD